MPCVARLKPSSQHASNGMAPNYGFKQTARPAVGGIASAAGGRAAA
jgi:hypothetical protein